MMNERPKRKTKPPLTYWEEYVQTDEWYLKELVADVPEEEMKAACEDSDFSISEEDGSDADDCSDAEESVQWTSEGESSSEGEDGASTSSSGRKA